MSKNDLVVVIGAGGFIGVTWFASCSSAATPGSAPST
jgi:hypothetical protein